MIITQIIVTMTEIIVIQSTQVIILDKVQCMGHKACRLGTVVCEWSYPLRSPEWNTHYSIAGVRPQTGYV